MERRPVADRLAALEFSYYTPAQVRALSVLQVIEPQAFKDHVPRPGGLEDPLLGPPLSEHGAFCATCEQQAADCSGHCGHIELLLPVYNPFTVNWLLRVMRAICLSCHRFRMMRGVASMYKKVLTLLRKGSIVEALEFKRLSETVLRKDKEEPPQLLQQAKRRLAEEIGQVLQKGMGKEDVPTTSCENKIFALVEEQLFSRVLPKCPFCNKVARTIKKEGTSKFILRPEPKRKQSEESRSGEQSGTKEEESRVRLLLPSEVREHVERAFERESGLMRLLFGRGGEGNEASMFFVETLVVPPTRFRPVSIMNEQKYLNDQTVLLLKILQANRDLRSEVLLAGQHFSPQEQRQFLSQFGGVSNRAVKESAQFRGKAGLLGSKEIVEKWLQLQGLVGCLFDSSRGGNAKLRQLRGVRQVLERKEGLFRMKIMGKRVNFAARSVISPDPSLKTSEVGIPLFMAKKLTFPEPVNEWNAARLRTLLLNGPDVYPGAQALLEGGRLIHLDMLSQGQRVALGRNLLSNPERKVILRHVASGDEVFFNRQPTLHRPSLMSHRVKVLPREQTLRMHYANCKSYNADFDGDEMNLHAVQNYVVKAECALNLADEQYPNITNGSPIRELIQDQVVAAALLSLPSRVLTPARYQQLLFAATAHLALPRLVLHAPAIIKPKRLYTGKQLFSNIIELVTLSCGAQAGQGLTVRSAAKISKGQLGPFSRQAEVVLLCNQLVCGVIDKGQIGSNSSFGIMHSFFQMYGGEATGKLFTSLSKLLTHFLQMRGFSCGLLDLLLEPNTVQAKVQALENLHRMVYTRLCAKLGVPPSLPQGVSLYNRGGKGTQASLGSEDLLVQKIKESTIGDREFVKRVDGLAMQETNEEGKSLVGRVFEGLVSKFPGNMFSTMVATGAKGSHLNHTQCSAMLGQQTLEGARVPPMASGATLPCFPCYSPNVRHWGFIGDCFLTGLRPQDFYFHCMAGREGLVDTAIKTSRSGYLQRCLMKNLEGLAVAYDYSVRDGDGSLVQLYYGEDGLDPNRALWLNHTRFIMDNLPILGPRSEQLSVIKRCPKVPPPPSLLQFYKSRGELALQTKQNLYPSATHRGSISTRLERNLSQFIAKQNLNKSQALDLKKALNYLFVRGMVPPGEAVGCIAAQSIGEPATQMTLNTFHTAGHGGTNLTLGIPRLREILMTTSENIKTPMMEIFFEPGTPPEQVRGELLKLKRVTLLDVVVSARITENKVLAVPLADRARRYAIQLTCYDWGLLAKGLAVSAEEVLTAFRTRFLRSLLGSIDSAVGKRRSDEQFRGQQFLQQYSTTGSTVRLQLRVPIQTKKFLMGGLLRSQLGDTVVREVPGLGRAVCLTRKGEAMIECEGVNFRAVGEVRGADFRRTSSNDTRHILGVLGIEAARLSIVNEILRVLRVYGVQIDLRHLFLIADFMTFPGSPRAMSRNSIEENPSPLLKMSFETSMAFLTEAARSREREDNRSPSSRITLGRVPLLGTGCFDILVNP